MAKPEIRLKGFEGEWSKSPLSSFSKKVTKKNGNLQYRITLTNSAEYGVINQLDFFDHDISNGDNIRGYYVVEPDDFVYNPRVSVTAPVGPINRSMLNYIGVMSPLYYVFKTNDIDKDYLSYFFKTKKWHNYMRINGNNGARFDRISMSDDVFALMPISYPRDNKEQQSIADYFKSLDSMIQGATKKIASLKQMKQACLVSMFPQAGETTPRVRFKGFKGEWLYVEVSECLSVCKDRNNSETYGKGDVLSVSDDYGVVNQIELLGRSYAGKSVANYRILRKGHIVYTKSPLKVKPFGIIKVNKGKDGIVSTLYAVYTPMDWVSAEFINYYFEPSYRMNKYIHPLVNKGAKNDMKVSDENVLKGKIYIPKEKKEQEQIASFFRSLDSQISLQELRLEKLKQIKSACLDKMFV